MRQLCWQRWAFKMKGFRLCWPGHLVFAIVSTHIFSPISGIFTLCTFTVWLRKSAYPWPGGVVLALVRSRRWPPGSKDSSSVRRSRPGQAQIRSSTDWRPSTCPSRSRVKMTCTGRRPRPPTHELKHMNWNRLVTHSAPAAAPHQQRLVVRLHKVMTYIHNDVILHWVID